MASHPFRLEEATIDDIHSAFRSGEITCRGLVELYLARIDAYDKSGPELNSILTVNQKALQQAEEFDTWKWTALTFPANTFIAAQADLPAISLPAGFAEEGVPVGLELAGRPYDEATLLRLAYSFEREAGHRQTPESVPPLPDEPQ